MARLGTPKEPVLSLVPWLMGKAILQIFKNKIFEPIESLIENEPGKRHGQQQGVASAQNMVFLFCFGLITSSQVSLDVIDSLR